MPGVWRFSGAWCLEFGASNYAVPGENPGWKVCKCPGGRLESGPIAIIETLTYSESVRIRMKIKIEIEFNRERA
jgi:hypothetical protein